MAQFYLCTIPSILGLIPNFLNSFKQIQNDDVAIKDDAP